MRFPLFQDESSTLYCVIQVLAIITIGYILIGTNEDQRDWIFEWQQ